MNKNSARPSVPRRFLQIFRASILTGLYTTKHRVIDNNRLVPEGTVFFPQYLRQAGYQTAFVGKWHMGHEGDDPKPGFHHWVSFRGQGTYPPSRNGLNVNGTRVPQKGYITDELTDYALEWLQGRSGDKPFFLYISHKAVHANFTPAERHEAPGGAQHGAIAGQHHHEVAGGAESGAVQGQLHGKAAVAMHDRQRAVALRPHLDIVTRRFAAGHHDEVACSNQRVPKRFVVAGLDLNAVRPLVPELFVDGDLLGYHTQGLLHFAGVIDDRETVHADCAYLDLTPQGQQGAGEEIQQRCFT